MKAPTYPEGNLSMRIYSTHYEGDIREWNLIGKLVGVKVPPPIPDRAFEIVPVLIVLIAIISLIAAFDQRWLVVSMIMSWILLIALTAFTQYSLYVFGHDLDPDRPLRYIEPFTPPVIGISKIGTLTTFHLPHVGSFLFVVASLLLYWGYRTYKKELGGQTKP